MKTLKDENNFEVFFTEAKQCNGHTLCTYYPTSGQSADISSIVKIPFANILETAWEWAFY